MHMAWKGRLYPNLFSFKLLQTPAKRCNLLQFASKRLARKCNILQSNASKCFILFRSHLCTLVRPAGGETKLFRDGNYPVLRGTTLMLDNLNAYVWTTGYVPQLDTNRGPEAPNPLSITILRSKLQMPPMRTMLTSWASRRSVIIRSILTMACR